MVSPLAVQTRARIRVLQARQPDERGITKRSLLRKSFSINLLHILEREFDWPPILPADSAPLPPPSIIMKMDIEGPDPRLIGALMRSGALCSVNFTYAEHLLPHHIQLVNDFFNFAQCSSTISNMDDEGLHDTNIPLLEYSPTEGE
jgi:hypothetical protein